MDKFYIDANSLLDDSFRLADKILKSGFEPNYIVGIWRGGTPIGIAVQEYMDYVGISTDHIAIRTSSYSGIAQRSSRVRVHGLGYIIDNISADDRLLIVDDVFDTGLSIDAVLRELREKCRRNTPDIIKVATVYYKPAKRKVDTPPDFYVHETNEWLVFPHELHGLSPQEIAKHKSPVVAEIVAKS
jgi:hypothetical protein